MRCFSFLGDPHASERIGPSCAKFQTTVTVCELAAAALGANQDQLAMLQGSFAPSMERYHGRSGLFQWMFRQVTTKKKTFSAYSLILHVCTVLSGPEERLSEERPGWNLI